MEVDLCLWTVTSLAAVVVSLVLVRFWYAVWWRQRRFKAFMNHQGVKGPPSSLTGNIIQQIQLREKNKLNGMSGISHDIVDHVTPEVTLWSSLYGKPYSTWMFSEPLITVFDPESLRDVMSKQFANFPKSDKQLQLLQEFFGRGILGVNGDEWSHRRNLLIPAFHTQRLKGMVSSVRNCTKNLVECWKSCLTNEQVEVEVTVDIKKLAADIISHTAFGSSYKKGERVFEGLHILIVLLKKRFYYSWLPFFRYHPTPLNFRIWNVNKEIDEVLLSLIQERRKLVKSGEKPSYGNDLLGLVLEGSEKGGKHVSNRDLIDECKTFYLAGHETTASLLSWTLLLLALNPDWQDRARAEIQEHGFQDSEALGKLKVLGMIINESLRLYPPVVGTDRGANKDTVLNGLKIPKGTGVTLPILSFHHDKELWGDDANEFKPERFAQGAAKASKHPNAFVPFSLGPRVCIGQTFAVMEAKIAIAMLLNEFSFRVSPSYRHNPTVEIVIVPAHGIHLLLEKV